MVYHSLTCQSTEIDGLIKTLIKHWRPLIKSSIQRLYHLEISWLATPISLGLSWPRKLVATELGSGNRHRLSLRCIYLWLKLTIKLSQKERHHFQVLSILVSERVYLVKPLSKLVELMSLSSVCWHVDEQPYNHWRRPLTQDSGL